MELRFEERGKGPVLLLVHGFPLDRRVWDAQMAALADTCRVVAVDLRGFGESTSAEPFTIESLGDDLHALVQKLGGGPVALAGLSMGGYVALGMARKHPADLRALALVDTKSEADTAEARQNRMKMIEAVRAGGSKAAADAMMPKMLAPDAAERRPQLAARLRQIMESCPPLTIEHALLAMRDRPDYTGDLPGIKMPTLIIVGEADQITPPAVAQGMAGRIPGARLAVIKGAGHMAPMEQPEQVNRALREFLLRL